MNQDEARVTRLLQRLEKLPNTEQTTNLTHLTTSLTHLQSQWQQSRHQNQLRLDHLSSRIETLHKAVTASSLQRERREQHFLDALATAQQNCSQMITQYSRQQAEAEAKFEQRAAQLLKTHSVEMQDIANTDKDVGEELRSYREMLPELGERLEKNRSERGELEDRIYLEFADKLTKLKQTFDEHCRVREKEHSSVLGSLNRIKEHAMEAIKRQHTERQLSESLLLQVIEKTIDRIAKID